MRAKQAIIIRTIWAANDAVLYSTLQSKTEGWHRIAVRRQTRAASGDGPIAQAALAVDRTESATDMQRPLACFLQGVRKGRHWTKDGTRSWKNHMREHTAWLRLRTALGYVNLRGYVYLRAIELYQHIFQTWSRHMHGRSRHQEALESSKPHPRFGMVLKRRTAAQICSQLSSTRRRSHCYV